MRGGVPGEANRRPHQSNPHFVSTHEPRLAHDATGSLRRWLMSFAVCGMLSPLAVKSQFLQPDAIYSFTQPVGRTSALIQGSDGLLYGVTSSGGSNGYGSAFRITTNGVLTTLVSFTVTNA